MQVIDNPNPTYASRIAKLDPTLDKVQNLTMFGVLAKEIMCEDFWSYFRQLDLEFKKKFPDLMLATTQSYYSGKNAFLTAVPDPHRVHVQQNERLLDPRTKDLSDTEKRELQSIQERLDDTASKLGTKLHDIVTVYLLVDFWDDVIKTEKFQKLMKGND